MPKSSAAVTRGTVVFVLVVLALMIFLVPPVAAGPASVARGVPHRPGALALVVGSNRGGPGQRDLRFAHEDARRVADVLTHVGGFAAPNVELVLEPGRGALLAAFARLGQRLTELARRGEPTLFLFYYSGHARAHALNMGRDELGLADLRQRVMALPATVRVAILDACQAGAISGIKGAQPAADFTFNSVNDLHTAGVAVLASSSASELSQEAELLRSSYFTHHLVVGLRGAADADGDGGVTLSEAYRYAYHRTLVSTASTAVGKQHVTLETRLRGKGEMTLTYPARSGSTLELPARLSGQVLVHRRAGEVVVAELYKAPGKLLRLALPAGGYVAYLGAGRATLRCAVELQPQRAAALAPELCVRAPRAATGVKGAEPPRFGLELGFGGLVGRDDGYNHQLENFGFSRQGLFRSLHPAPGVTFSFALSPHLALALGWTMLDRAQYTRALADLDKNRRTQTFSWSSHALGLYARGVLPLVDGIVNLYGQAGGGLAWGSTLLVDPLQSSAISDDEVQFGYHVGVAGGLNVMPWRFLGLYLQVGYTYAPVIENMVGDVHNSGGASFQLGVRGAL